MKKHFRYILLTTLILLVSLFAGCMNITIKGEITPESLAVYQGDIVLDVSKSDYTQQALTQQSLLKLKDYWTNIGYETDVVLEDNNYHIYFRNQKQCSTYEEAFDALFEMMTDEYSPFQSLSYAFTPYDNRNEYTITGSMDIRDAFDSEIYANMQDDIQQKINNELNNLDAQILFVLPYQEDFGQPPSTTKTYRFDILANEVTQFSLQGRMNNQNMAQENSELIKTFNYYSNLKYLLLGILAILVILAVWIIIRLRKN